MTPYIVIKLRWLVNAPLIFVAIGLDGGLSPASDQGTGVSIELFGIIRYALCR